MLKHRKTAGFNTQGFTLVELIVTLVIVSILAIVAIARFLRADTFNPVVVHDQLISMARTAQQSALGRSPVSLTVTPNAAGSEVVIQSVDGAGVIEEVALSLAGVSLSADINNTSSCEASSAAPISSAAPLTIAFGELGNLADTTVVNGATGNPVNSALRVCVNDSATYSVCVSPSGFAYGGDCDI